MIRGLILDLDGTLYTGTREVPGAARFVARMRALDIRCIFATNRSSRSPEAISEHLAGFGIPCTPADVLTSAEATASHLKPGSAYVVGEEGLADALRRAGFTIRPDHPDYVVVGYDRTFDYEKLKTAMRAILDGAQFIATNPDKILILEDGIHPGAGAAVGAITACTGAKPLVIGKPERILYDIALERLGLPRPTVVAVGDNLDTDIAAGLNAALRTALILSGVSKRSDLATSAVLPNWVALSFADLEGLIEAEMNDPAASTPA